MDRHSESSPERAGPRFSDPRHVLDRKVRLTRLVLLFERVWRALLWPFAAAGLFLIVSFAGLWSAIPDWSHTLLLGGFAIGGLVSLAPLFRLDWPSREQALRRLERHSGVSHRPASSFDDSLPSQTSPEQQALWGAHKERISRLLDKLRPGLPHPRLAAADPYALRAALLLTLAVSLAFAGDRALERIGAALDVSAGMPSQQYRIDAWVTPPLYTGKPPIVLAEGFQEQGIRAVTVPVKSLLLVRVNSAGEAPRLAAVEAGKKSAREIEPTSRENGVSEYKVPLTQPVQIEVGGPRHVMTRWHFDLIEDKTPEIELTEEPSRTPRGSLRFSFRAKDDYGVAQAEANFALAGSGGKPATDDEVEHKPEAGLEPPVIQLKLPRANAKIAEARVFRDLTAHPWAGLRVLMTLVARDQAGQEGRSPSYEMVLPERKFTKPLAKAVVEQRRNLVRAPDKRDVVLRALEALTIAPDKFIEDKTVYLGLRSAYWRLKQKGWRSEVGSVASQLWDIALRIEDGDLPEAEAALQAAQERLRRALEEGAPDEEIQRLIAELRQALGRFLQALAEQARKKGNMAQMPEGLGDKQMLSSKDLEQLLKNIEKLAKTGAKDLAQRLLSELQDLVQRLQMGAMNQNSQSQRMMKMVEGLGEIIMREQQLLDETFNAQRGMQDGERGEGEQGRQGRPGQQGREGQGAMPYGGAPRPGDRFGRGEDRGQGKGRGPGKGERRYGMLSDKQSEIRKQLDALLEGLRGMGSRAPDQLEGAGRAMREAEKALDEENLDRATQQQTLALDRLRQGTQSLAEKVLQSLATRMGRGGQGQKDPFGRPERTQGPDLGTSVKVPDEIDIQRAREILDEIRRRLSEPTRPMLELDYLERLLRQF